MIDEAVKAIEAGLVVGMPTDTVYGIGVDPLNDEAVSRLFDIKGRPEHKPIGILAATLDQAATIGHLEGEAADLAARHWPGALTLVVRPLVALADWVGNAQMNTVGVRVPDHPMALEFLTRTGPLAVTSANRSGGPEAMSDAEAKAILGDDVAVYIAGTCPGGEASTVIDATGVRLTVLRRGPIEI